MIKTMWWSDCTNRVDLRAIFTKWIYICLHTDWCIGEAAFWQFKCRSYQGSMNEYALFRMQGVNGTCNSQGTALHECHVVIYGYIYLCPMSNFAIFSEVSSCIVSEYDYFPQSSLIYLILMYIWFKLITRHSIILSFVDSIWWSHFKIKGVISK